MAIQGSDGFWYNSQVDADAVNPAGRVDNGASKANYQMMNLTGKIILIIFLIVPIVIAKVVGVVFGVLGKIPKVGRVLQTILWAIASAIAGLYVFGAVFTAVPVLADVMPIIGLLAGFAISGYWFFLYHFYVVQYMGVKIFSDLLTKTFAIVFYGGIAGLIIGGIIGGDSIAAKSIPFLIVCAAALIFYVNKTKQFMDDVKQIRPPVTAKTKAVFTIMALALIGLGVVLGITEAITSGVKRTAVANEKETAITERIAKDPNLAIIRRETPFQATVTSAITADGRGLDASKKFEIPAGATITITGFYFTDKDGDSAGIKYNNGDYYLNNKYFGSINPR
jgi:hypothetical protein